MRIIRGILLGACVVAAACGGGDKAKVQKVKDAMCACKDKACVDKVEAESRELSKSLEATYKDEKDVPADLLALLDEIDKCETKAKEGEAAGKVKALADAACACKDKACVEKVMRDVEAMGTEVMASNPSPEMAKEAQRAGECMAKVMAAAAAADAPPLPADPAAGSGSGAADPAAGSGSGSGEPAAPAAP